jgi:hypothetical protein
MVKAATLVVRLVMVLNPALAGEQPFLVTVSKGVGSYFARLMTLL